jgi:hypothetical protein
MVMTIPASPVVVDTFAFPALAPVRPASALRHIPRCPQNSGHPPPLLHRWLDSIGKRAPAHPFGTPCHTAHRSESQAIPSLCRATPSATSEHYLGLLGSSPIPPSFVTSCVSFQLRPLPSPGITRLPRYCGPLRHPRRPGLALTSCQLVAVATTAGASRVASGPLCLHAVANTPAGPMGPFARLLPSTSAFPRFSAGQLLHHPFRGLHSVHSRYGLQTRQVANATLYTRGFSSFVTSTTAPIAPGWSEPDPGREFSRCEPAPFHGARDIQVRRSAISTLPLLIAT